MELLHKKYDSNIYNEEIYSFIDKNFVRDLNTLDKVCVENKKIKLCFPSSYADTISDILDVNILIILRMVYLT